MTKKRKISSIKRNYWKHEEEILLKQWADNAKCYQWMHNKSRQIYQKKNAMYTIPVIIISTITGTANFAQDRFSEKIKEYVVITIGSLSLIAGIITTVYQFLKISEINEGHRVAMLSWGKFSRNLEAELSRHPLDRMSASELIKISKEEYNRLIEISPFIPNKVLENFNKKFKNSEDLFKPEIGNIIKPMNLFNMDDSARQNMIDELNQDVNIKNSKVIKKETKKISQLDKFKTSFYELNNRYPNKDEIHKNMKYINDENYSSLSETSTIDSNQSNNSLGQENYNNSDDNVNYNETHIDMSEIDNEDIINDSEEIILDNGTDLDKRINKETIAYL